MSRLKGQRLENEVQKARVEQNWERLRDTLMPAVNMAGSGMHHMAHFLLAEMELELFIDRSANFPTPTTAHKDQLRKVKKHLGEVFDANDIKLDLALEACLLQAKYHYLVAQFRDALEDVTKSGLEKRNVDFKSLRTLRLVCEAYAIKGLCQDALPPKSSSKWQKDSREEQIVSSFEKSADLAMMYLQEIEKNLSSSSSLTLGGHPSGALTVNTGGSNQGTLDRNATYSSGDFRVQVSQSGSSSVPVVCSSTSVAGRVGDLVEVAVQKIPIHYMKKKEKDTAIKRYRGLLRGLDHRSSQMIQQNLARQLAEVLLRGVSCSQYWSPSEGGGAGNFKPGSILPPDHDSIKLMPSTGLTAGHYLFDPTFVPHNRTEEVLLLLLLANSIVCREAVLSRSDEFGDARKNSLLQVKAVENLLTLVLSSIRQYHFLSDIWERAMKFAYDDVFIWFQFGLSLICQARYSRSSSILEECLKINPADPLIHLFLAKLCIEQLGRYEDGIRFAQTAVDLAGQSRPEAAVEGGWLVGRGYVLLGLASSLLAQSMPTFGERRAKESEAAIFFSHARAKDPNDVMAWFYSALQSAIARNLDEASQLCEEALDRYSDHPASVLLLALILTAQNSYRDAMDLVKESLDNHPNHFGLIVLRMKLELYLGWPAEAILSAKDLLLFWKREPFHLPDQIRNVTQETEASVHDVRGGGNSPMNPVFGGVMGTPSPGAASAGGPGSQAIGGASMGVTGSSSNNPGSTPGVGPNVDYGTGLDRVSMVGSFPTANAACPSGASDYGPAASTVSDSLGHMTASSGQRLAWSTWRLQANVWLELGEMFLEAGRLQEVEQCVEEAVATFPSSHQALYLEGRVHEISRRYPEAKACYLGAVSIAPNYLPALRHLALTYKEEGNLRMAEKVLRDLIRVEPMDKATWFALAELLSEIGQSAQAEECMATALTLEDSAPILPYSIIPRVLNL